MDVLDGVQAIGWSALDHCFGSSDDIPELLRETAGGSQRALETLGDYMIHQGTLYEATPSLVRFLARIAASGILTVPILDLIGIAARNDTADQDPGVRGKTRAALVGEITGLIPLLADPSAEVRDAAAWALPQSLAAGHLVAALRARWIQEAFPPVAASVLRGLSHLDQAAAAALAAAALADQDSAVRLIAASACLAGGLPWSGDLHEAALAWLADGALLEGFRWSFWSGHPFSDLAGALAERGKQAAAVELIASALTRPAAPGTRKAVLLAANHLAEISRGAAPGLIAPLAMVAVGPDPDASMSAIILLQKLGAVADVADELAVVADAEGPGRRPDWALACLVQAGDPRCVRLLARDHRHRPLALDALSVPAKRPPFSAALLAEIRRCLGEQLLGPGIMPRVAGLIGSWGPAAVAAVPELPAASGSLSAASRLHALAGEEDLLLAAIESGLTQAGHAAREAAEAARAVTPSRRLLPALAAALDSAASQARPDHGMCVELGLALWHHSGDPARAVEAIGAGIRADTGRGYFGPGAANAARAAAILGPAARPLIPAILPLLDSPQASPAAAQALLSIDPGNRGGVALTTLAERLLLPLGRARSSTQMSAIEVLGQIGLPRLPAHVVARLDELANQDRRITQSGNQQTLIANDDWLRAAIRGLLDDTRQPAHKADGR
ncbi:MAG TPA: hypothetical protein VMU95_26670 [Trebonia sp.]|nr:hypothetical protein [Trebonia sp.]